MHAHVRHALSPGSEGSGCRSRRDRSETLLPTIDEMHVPVRVKSAWPARVRVTALPAEAVVDLLELSPTLPCFPRLALAPVAPPSVATPLASC